MTLRSAKVLPLPYLALTVDDVFPSSEYAALLREYEFYRKNCVWHKGTYERGKEDGLFVPERRSLARSLFDSPEWIEAISSILGLPLLPFTELGFHFHPKGQPSSKIHHDYYYVEVMKPSHTLVPYIEFTKESAFGRAATLIYYLGNDWATSDGGGATGFCFEAPGEAEAKRICHVPPVNNSLVLFENTPDSLHYFVGDPAGDRHSIIAWYLSDVGALKAKLGTAPLSFFDRDKSVKQDLLEPHSKGCDTSSTALLPDHEN